MSQKPDEEYIDILYNDGYGDYCLSKEAIELYIKKKPDAIIYKDYDDGEDDKIDYEQMSYKISRSDPLLIEIFHKIGDKINSTRMFNNKLITVCYIQIVRILKKYENYYHFHDYDGLETLNIDYDTYVVDNIKTILNDDSIISDDKVTKCKKILDDSDKKSLKEDIIYLKKRTYGMLLRRQSMNKN